MAGERERVNGFVENGYAPRRHQQVLNPGNHSPIIRLLQTILNDLAYVEASNEEVFDRMKTDLENEEKRYWDNMNMGAYWATKSSRRDFEAMVQTLRARNEELGARIAWMMHQWEDQFN